ncbi:MAG: hypothetical protein HY263_01630 [Chloroflexi bacterium]|nr:hypothetical protein [Chloroflexota bacterium]
MTARQPGRGLWTLGALVAAFLVLAIAKPWAWGASEPRATLPPRTAAPASSGPPATPDLSPEGLAASVCLGTGAWRVATIETWRLVIAGQIVTQRVRVWHAVDPARAAEGPADPRIPIVGVVAMEIDALGWCAPSTGSGRPIGSVDVTVWRLADTSRRGGAQEPEVVTVRRVAPPAGATSLAALYREVTDCVSGFGCSGSAVPLLAPAWSPGRYVFQYAEHDSGATWWFGADVQVLPAPTAVPTEAPGPDAVP